MCVDLKRFDFIHFVAALILLSAIRFSLIIGGMLPELFKPSFENTAFSILSLLILAAMGWRFSKDEIIESARKGAIAVAATFVVLLIGMVIGKSLGKPVMGIALPIESLVLVLFINLIFNIVIGASAVMAGAFLGRLMTSKKQRR